MSYDITAACMLQGLIHHKKETKQFLLGLVVTDERIDGALLETSPDGQGKIYKTEFAYYTGEWEEAIETADQIVSSLETELPQGAELKNVIFGLFPSWLEGEKIKDTYLKNLKKLTADLALTALGYVELPIAVAHLLQKDEGTAQTVILAGIETLNLTVSIFKIGKFVGNVIQKRTDNIATDLETALATFTDVEILPSRILLYGPEKDLEKIKSELLNYPWQKKANFLHLPKIEILPQDFAVRAVAISSASEIDFTPVTPEKKTVTATTTYQVAEEKSNHKDEIFAIAKDLGFEEDDETKNKQEEPATNLSQSETEDVAVSQMDEDEMVNVVPLSKSRGIKIPKFAFKIPQFTFSLKIPRLNRLGILGFWGVLLVLVLGGYFVSFYILPTAHVEILVSPQKFDQDVDIKVDKTASQVNIQEQILPVKEVSGEVSGTFTVATTGTKTVGEKAKGEVTIYNKTLNNKHFSAGTILTSGNLKFTLDNDVMVASASEGIDSLIYGTKKAQITASEIGESSNLGPGTEFSFADLPTTSYSARNEKALFGGSSKKVNVVAREDKQAVRQKAEDELKAKAETQLIGSLNGDEKILDNALTLKVLEENFTKEIGTEADELGLNLNLAVTALVYKSQDLNALIDDVIKANLPNNYEYKGDAQITLDKVIENEDRQLFKYRVVANLLPKLDVENIVSEIKGKRITEVVEIIKRKNSVSGIDIKVEAPFAFLKNTLPRNPAKIKVSMKAL